MNFFLSRTRVRIGIRKHVRGEAYTVFYTDDFDFGFIERMDSYFNSNKLMPRNPVIHEDWKAKLEGMKIRSNIKSEIMVLAGCDNKMQQAIVRGKEYKREVTFSDLKWLGITRSRDEKDKYKALVGCLKKIGIFLEIVSGTKKSGVNTA